ncbi:helix-turn-helix domain-containing protein [Sphingomonas sp.]|uniref:helix-turn-helix domain-containing protein n=1 Tax=Sphingomonas sp. TaxID=28214 RepID=UPI0025CCA9B2|nr:helix-turn-helix domain-containing protein [Sphingomonas sp.]
MADDDIQRAERAKRGSPYLNTAQAAHYLGISERSMQRMRARNEGPVPRRHARMVQYHIDDLDAWSRARADGRQI